MNDITERFIMIYAYLLSNKIVKNKSEFAQNVGISSSMMTEIEKKRSNIGVISLQNAIKTYNVNPLWLLTGEGEMIQIERKNNQNTLTSVKSYPKLSKQNEGIPLVNISATAGFGTLDVCIEEKNIIAKYVIPDFKGADLMIPIVGDSMEPKFTAGDIVACKILKSANLIQWGKAYIVASKTQGFMMKRLYMSENNAYLECQSYNPQYPPFLIEKEDISGIALVIGSVHLETVMDLI